MADVYGPFDGVPWSQSQWYRHVPGFGPSGVIGTPVASASTGSLGLTIGGLSGGSYAITMTTGRANVRGAGYERTSTSWSGSTPVNSTGNPRLDRLVLRRDLAAKTVVPTVIQGTPASSPSLPALTQVEDGTWDLPLFYWTTPASSGATVSGITDQRRWIDPEQDNGRGVVGFEEYTDATPNVLNTSDTTLTIYSLPAIVVPRGRRLRLTHTVTLDSQGGDCAFGFRYRLNGTTVRTSTMQIPFINVPESRTFVHEMTPGPVTATFTISGVRAAGTGTPRLLCDVNTGPTLFMVEEIGAVSL